MNNLTVGRGNESGAAILPLTEIAIPSNRILRRTRMKTLLFIASIVLIAAPVAAQAQDVKVDYDHSVDFTKYKTYSWIKGRPTANPHIHKLIVEEIDRQLLSRGLERVEANPDLNIAYYASLDENINIGAVEYMKNSDWKRWGDHNPVYGPKMGAMLIARMVLDIVDSSANRLIWRGRARDAYTPNQAKGEKRANKAVAKLFTKYPTSSSE
jgi:hypothetical protein